MYKFKACVRFAALAAVSTAGVLMAQAAQAQAWVETRAWPEVRVYEDGPVIFRDNPRAAPRYERPTELPRRAVRQIIEGQGFEVIGPLRFTGDAYIVQALDQQRRVRRLVVDARSGRIVQSASLVAQPRAGGAMESVRGALPPRGVGPRGEWEYGAPPAANMQERRARERFARQSPDGFIPPRERMDDVNIAPGFNPLSPEPKAATRKAPPPKERAVKKPQTKAAPKQAARTPVEEAPKSVKAEPPAVESVREAARPDPVNIETVKPQVANPVVANPEIAKPEAPRTEPAKVEAAVAPPVRADQPKAATVPAPVATPQSASRDDSVLRRPSQKAETTGSTTPRTGVAAAPSASSDPSVSTGAAPQRKAPRVVYPGPGASAPSPDSAD